MPIIKQAIKRVRQDAKKTENNRHYKSRMRSMIKLLATHVKENDLEKAQKLLPQVVKAIDMAAKKNIIHKKNASRKKSGVQRTMNKAIKTPEKKAESEPKPKKEAKSDA